MSRGTVRLKGCLVANAPYNNKLKLSSPRFSNSFIDGLLRRSDVGYLFERIMREQRVARMVSGKVRMPIGITPFLLAATRCCKRHISINRNCILPREYVDSYGRPNVFKRVHKFHSCYIYGKSQRAYNSMFNLHPRPILKHQTVRGSLGGAFGGLGAIPADTRLKKQEYIRNNASNKKQASENGNRFINSKLAKIVASLLFLILPLLSFYRVKTSIDDHNSFSWRRCSLGIACFLIAHLFGLYVLLPFLALANRGIRLLRPFTATMPIAARPTKAVIDARSHSHGCGKSIISEYREQAALGLRAHSRSQFLAMIATRSVSTY